MSQLSQHVIGPREGSPHTHTVILLHGRDSSADEFAMEFFESEASGLEQDRTLTALFPTIKWVFPQAKPLRSKRFGTDDMLQWFDIWSLDDLQEQSEMQVPGLRSSVDLIIKTIKDEELLVPRDKIYLGGISQGFAVYVCPLLRCTKICSSLLILDYIGARLLATFLAEGKGGFAGLIGFCSWMPLEREATCVISTSSDPGELLRSIQRLYLGDDDATDNAQQSPLAVPHLLSTPILLQHNRDDGVIAFENGARLRDLLGKLGFQTVEWHAYDHGGHWVNEPQGVDDFVSFLRSTSFGG